MQLEDYKKALMLVQEPAALLTVTELRERVTLLNEALQFKAWRVQVALARMSRLEAGDNASLDITPEELDELWPWPDAPEVSLKPNGFVHVQRLGDGVKYLAPVFFAAVFLAAAAFLVG